MGAAVAVGIDLSTRAVNFAGDHAAYAQAPKSTPPPTLTTNRPVVAPVASNPKRKSKLLKLLS